MFSQRTPSNNFFRFIAVTGILLFIVIAFISGFYFATWRLVKGQNSLSILDVLVNPQGYAMSDEFDAGLFLKVLQSLKNDYVNQPVDEKELFYGALSGMASSLDDPYSIFLNPSETSSFNQELEGVFEGIGAEIGIKNDQLTIIAPLSDSPALQAGLKAGDKILSIDDQLTSEMTLDEAISLIRGPQGSEVVLKILSPESTEPRDVTIKRQEITVASVSWELKENNIAYVEISHFNSDTDARLRQLIPQILLASPRGIILDLRNNPGGYLDAAINVAGEFLDNRVIVYEDFGKSKKEYKSSGLAQLKDVNLVVLVNQGSASAAEIVAGALQDYQRALIVGEQTYGKGTVQDFEEFSDGSSLKLTVAKWLTPNGRSIDKDGIAPDLAVTLTDEDYNADRDPQYDKAVELLSK